jgi:hypothetical protein
MGWVEEAEGSLDPDLEVLRMRRGVRMTTDPRLQHRLAE